MNVTTQELNISSRFRGQVIRQIYRVWLWRKFLPIFIIEIALLSFFLYQLGRVAFIERIIQNAVKVLFANPPQIFHFLSAGFMNAPLATKILGLGVLVLVAFFLRHLTQGILRFILVKKNYFERIHPV